MNGPSFFLYIHITFFKNHSMFPAVNHESFIANIAVSFLRRCRISLETTKFFYFYVTSFTLLKLSRKGGIPPIPSNAVDSCMLSPRRKDIKI